MSAANAISLKSRVTQMVWIMNAMIGLSFALLGTVMVWNVFGYDAQLAPLMERTGVAFAVTGMTLTLLSLRRASSISASR